MQADSPETPQPPRSLFVQIVGVFVALLGLVMIALPTAQTFSRRFGGADLAAFELVKHLTLWIGFVGALLATATGKHLSLSTAEVIPEGLPRRAASLITRAASTLVCSLLAVAAWRVVEAESKSGRMVFGGLRVEYSEAIMPITLVGMALLFGLGPTFHAGNKISAGWLERGVGVGAMVLAFLLGKAAPGAALNLVLGISLGVAFLVGAPVFVAMGGVAMLLFWMDDVPISSVPSSAFELAKSATMPAIPLLTMAGYVLAEGGAAKRLVRAYKGFFGWLPGGVAVMATVVCAVFTTFTGGSGVTILAVGGLLVPMLKEEKYPEGFAYGVVTASGSLGLLFPPSLPVLLYAVVAQMPVERLFLGGLVPGVLMMAMVAGYGVYVGVTNKVARQKFVPMDALKGLWEAKWDLGLPTVVMAVFISGFGTVVEAAALGCAYALFVELVVFRSIHPVKDLPRVLATAATLVGAVIILMGMGLGFSAWAVDAELADKLLTWTQANVKSQWGFLLALNIGLLVLGSVLEIYAAIIVLAPLVAPIGVAYGIDPIHLGVVFLANLELGFLFPPMGLNLFLASSRFQKPLPYLYARTLPFLIILAIGVLLVTYLDFMTTGVVHLFTK